MEMVSGAGSAGPLFVSVRIELNVLVARLNTRPLNDPVRRFPDVCAGTPIAVSASAMKAQRVSQTILDLMVIMALHSPVTRTGFEDAGRDSDCCEFVDRRRGGTDLLQCRGLRRRRWVGLKGGVTQEPRPPQASLSATRVH